MLLKMMLLLILYNVRSERELMRTIPLRLDWIWFLGYDIDDEIPHHSVLSKARRRWGEEVFRELFQRVLLQAVESGLVDGEKLFADASLVEADASKDSVKRISRMELVSTYAELVKRLDDKEEESKKSGNRDDDKKSGRYSKVNKIHRSSTDPDATIVRKKGDAKLYYKVHRGVDDAFEIITSCKTTTGMVNEAHVLDDLVEDHSQLMGKKPGVVVADSKYGTKANFIRLKKQGMRTHIKDLSRSQQEGGSRRAQFSKEDFKYVKEGDYFVCPEGEKLQKRSYNPNRGWYEYKANKSRCNDCRLRLMCTRDKNGRTLKRHPDEHILELAKLDSISLESEMDLRKRQHLMERSFANGCRYGYKRSRWRHLWRVSIQQYLVATVQNLLKIMKYTGDPVSTQVLSAINQLKTSFLTFVRKFITFPKVLFREFIG